MVAVKADPMPGCVVTKPENVLVFSSLNDKYVPYKPGEKGKESPPATVQIAPLQTDLECSSKPTVVKHGTMYRSARGPARTGRRSSGRCIRPEATTSPTPTAAPPAPCR